MFSQLKFSALTVLLAFLFCVPAAIADEKTDKVYKFAVTDVVGLEELQREFLKFQEELSKLAGVSIKLYPVTNRTAVVESIRSKRLDFALSGPSEYVVARKKANVIPLVGLQRSGYRSVIVTKKSSGISSLSELKGKKIAFGDFGSTSYHLAPMQLLRDSGIDPTHDVKSVNVAKQVAWRSFLKDRVHAIGMGELRFHQYSEVEENLDPNSLVILAKTPILPGDVILAGEHVPTDVQERVRLAFEQHGNTLLNAMLTGTRNQKYTKMKFVSSVQDSDYNYIRQMYATAGYDEFAAPANG